MLILTDYTSHSEGDPDPQLLKDLESQMTKQQIARGKRLAAIFAKHLESLNSYVSN